MAEYINNSEKRKQLLQDLIQQLHDGRSVEEVKDDFVRLLGEPLLVEDFGRVSCVIFSNAAEVDI